MFKSVLTSSIRKICLLAVIIVNIGYSPILLAESDYDTSRIQYRTSTVSVPFYINDFLIEQPFIGGLNAPQFCHLDLNLDGQLDIIVFDRYDAKLFTYIRIKDDQFKYQPEYEYQLPKGNYYYKTADLNSDGKLDIFTSTKTGGLKIFKQLSPAPTGDLRFTDLGDLFYRNQYSEGDNLPLYNLISFPILDLPEIKDMDGDGDLDLLTYDAGNFTYRQFRDVRSEMGWSSDTFEFQIMDVCFGYFNEGVNNSIVLGECPPFTLKLKPRHANGSACFTFDEDSDGDIELVISNIGFSNFTKLKNGRKEKKTSFDTMVMYDTLFPSNTKQANGFVFPAGFTIDASGDGLPDLIVAPNGVPDGKETQQVWYYKNKGTLGKTEFEFQRTNFLIDKSLDFGGKSAPVFVDVDADGDLDLLIANNGDYAVTKGLRDKLTLFLNKGKKDSAVFVLENEDYLSISKSNDSLFHHSIPAVGDVDNDGDQDLLIGVRSGRVVYFENTAGVTKPVNWVFKSDNIIPKSGILGESGAAPCIYDFNNDGKNDLLVGFYNGKVVAFKNDGNGKFERFHSSAFGAKANEYRYDINPVGFISFGNAVPRIADLNNDGKMEMVLGTAHGTPLLYRIHGHSITDSLVGDTQWFKSYTHKGDSITGRMGYLLTPDLADINGDSIPEFIAGLGRGGLVWANSLKSIKSNLGNTTLYNEISSLKIYPNPATTNVFIEIPEFSSISKIEATDINGKIIISTVINSGETGVGFGIGQLPNGVYFVKAYSTNQIISTGKLLINR